MTTSAAALVAAHDVSLAQTPNPAPIFAPSYRAGGYTPQPHPLGSKPQPASRPGGFYRPFLQPGGSRFRGLQQRGFQGSWYFPFAWSSQFQGPMWLPTNFPYGSLPARGPNMSLNSNAGLRGNARRRVATTLGQSSVRLGPQWPAAQGPESLPPHEAAPPSRLDPDAPRPADRGVIEVLLPVPNAVVSLDGEKILSSGEVRALVTPVIDGETTYSFQVVATWLKDGKLTSAVREGPILPGELVVVDFRDEAARQTPPTSDQAAPKSPPPPQPRPDAAP